MLCITPVDQTCIKRKCIISFVSFFINLMLEQRLWPALLTAMSLLLLPQEEIIHYGKIRRNVCVLIPSWMSASGRPKMTSLLLTVKRYSLGRHWFILQSAVGNPARVISSPDEWTWTLYLFITSNQPVGQTGVSCSISDYVLELQKRWFQSQYATKTQTRPTMLICAVRFVTTENNNT